MSDFDCKDKLILLDSENLMEGFVKALRFNPAYIHKR